MLCCTQYAALFIYEHTQLVNYLFFPTLIYLLYHALQVLNLVAHLTFTIINVMKRLVIIMSGMQVCAHIYNN